jgi:flagellar hook-length control protein FliK
MTDARLRDAGLDQGKWTREVDEPALLTQAADATTPRKWLEAPAAPGAPPPAETARQVGAQLAAVLRGNGEGSFEVRLSPEELGRVTVTLKVADDTVVLSIQAERQETLELMRRHADVLQREFRDAGFTALSFSFGQGSPEGRADRATSLSPAVEDAAIDKASSAAPTRGSRPAPSSRLDLRL